MDSVIRQRINQLQAQCDIAQKHGKYADCIDLMEEIVSIKKTVFGLDHVEFQKSSERLCEYLNLAAMFNLQKQEFQACIDYLRKAELLCQNSLQFKSTTYNNLACYYRRVGKLRTALSYLIQALEMELKLQHPMTLADTHLNLCAVLSQLDKHEDALQHSMLSVILLQDQLLQTALTKIKKQKDNKDINDQRLAVLTIAYHNMGVQFEHLRRYDEALKIYSKALQISTDFLKQNHQLISNMTKVVNSANQQIEEQRKIAQLSRKGKVVRQASQNKREIYRDIARQAERFRNLPKLRTKDQYPIIEHSKVTVTSMNRTIGFRNLGKSTDKNFLSKKRPRVYKSTSDPHQIYQAKSAFLHNPQDYGHNISRRLESSQREEYTAEH